MSKTVITKKSRFQTALKPLLKTGLMATTLTVLGMANSYAAVIGLEEGQTVRSALTSQSLTDEYDDTPYNLYLYQGVPGEFVQIDMKSDDLDAYLIAGGNAKDAPDCVDCQSNDDGGEDFDSRLFYIVPEGGNVYIRAGSIDVEYGDYTLSAKKIPNNPMSAPIDLNINNSRNARLTSRSALDKTGSYFDLYTIKGQPNTLVSVLMESDDVDAYLAEVSVRGNNIDIIDSNDDADYTGDSTDSRLKVRLDDTGIALVQATTYDNLETGAYTIEAVPINEVTNIQPKRNIRTGDTITGRLTSRSPVYQGDYFFDAYSIQGLPGERVTVSVKSDDFDTVLNWGYMSGDNFIIAQENDDYYPEDDGYSSYESEDTDSQFTLVLDRDGRNVLMVTSYDVMSTGRYELSVRSSND